MSDLLTTRGITSEVSTDSEVIGHALLVDYDGHCPYHRLLDDCKDLPGLTVVFESSPGSWHVWNTTVRTKEETALAMLARKCDPMHISVGYRRGRWTLRVGPKEDIDQSNSSSEDYKDAPEPLTWWVNETTRPQSAAHVRLAGARLLDHGCVDGPEPLARVRARAPEMVGEHYRLEQYLTMTDELKREVDGNG